MELEDHPGYLGSQLGRFLIQADWPAYPLESGWENALRSLGNFPLSVGFRETERVGQAILLEAADTPAVSQKKRLYVAVWEEDVVKLHDQGLVDGVSTLTQYEWRLKIWESQQRFYVDFDGEFIPVSPLRRPEPPEDEIARFYQPKVPVIGDSGMRLTSHGCAVLEEILEQDYTTIPLEVTFRLSPILDLGLCDTAVREACLFLETELRKSLKSDKHGFLLIEEFCEEAEKLYLTSGVRTFRNELKATFAYVRNEYMHNFRHLNGHQARAIVARIGRFIELIRSLQEDKTANSTSEEI